MLMVCTEWLMDISWVRNIQHLGIIGLRGSVPDIQVGSETIKWYFILLFVWFWCYRLIGMSSFFTCAVGDLIWKIWYMHTN